ncbi:MAG: carbon-nitrogen hydrolase family protein [Halofilum sp. (in: g-proteobacteria)]|nr:carbon-nitrogen hydrolase family protein [Halofilum sp. (in: g-proteobacteria)]
MKPFSVAGVQMHISAFHGNVEAMGQQLTMLVNQFPWVDMVVFSELAPFGPLPQNAPEDTAAVEAQFQEMAREHEIWLIPGSMFTHENGARYNTTMVIDPAGEVVGRYHKMFPFMPYEHGVEPGHEFLVFDVPDVGRFGVTICYDLWFPETTRTMAAMGAEVILAPTLTNTIDRDVELSIARAMAAINQCYVIDVNGTGDGGYGRSIFVGPQGQVIHQSGSGPEVVPLQLNLDRVRWERENGIHGLGQMLKSFRDRRVEFPVYRPEIFDNSYLESLGSIRKLERRATPHRADSHPATDDLQLPPGMPGAVASGSH